MPPHKVPPARPRNLRLWAVAAAAVVAIGVVLAFATGGGNSASGGDRVLGAGEAKVHGVRYRVVVSTPAAKGHDRGPATLYFNEYVGSPPTLQQRFTVPVKFFRDSVIATFKVEADPHPNPQRTARIAVSWFHHAGDPTSETKYYRVTRHGIELY
jgi:hypothetical protein